MRLLAALSPLALFGSPALALLGDGQPLSPPDLGSGVSAGTFGALFGSALAVDGDLAVIGAPIAEGTTPVFGPTTTGGAWVYRLQGEQWVLEDRLERSVPVIADKFGVSVDIDATTQRAIVGVEGMDYFDPEYVNYAGGAVIFELGANGWAPVAELELPVPDFSYQGRQVAIDGDRAVVATHVGFQDAYVFELVGGQWTLTDTVPNPAPANHEDWAESIALEGDLLAVGAHGNDGDGVFNAGAVYLYRHTPGGWVEETVLRSDVLLESANLGTSLDLDGGRVVAGAHFEGWSPQATAHGAVYVFEQGPGGWSQSARLEPAPGFEGVRFGEWVDLDGDRLLAALPGPAAGDLRRGLLFEWDGSEWAHTRALEVEDQSGINVFVYSMGLSAGHAFLGANAFDGPFENSGEVWVAPLDALCANPASLSLSAGGTQQFELGAGLPHAGQLHLLLGSASGTAPGLPLGSELLPLAIDAYTLLTAQSPAASPLANSVGLLDAAGEASASFSLPAGAPAQLAGLVLHHAYVVVDPGTGVVDLASNAVSLSLQP